MSARAPFIHTDNNTSHLAVCRLVSLIPPAAGAVYFYGLRAFILIIFCALLFTVSDSVCNKIRGTGFVRDLASPFYGALLALLLPPGTPLYIAAVGVLFGSLCARQISGGKGTSFLNPALTGRLFIRLLFPSNELNMIDPGNSLSSWDGLFTGTSDTLGADLTGYSLSELFVGRFPSFLGTGSLLLILTGLVYMMARRGIRPYIPVSYIVTLGILLEVRDIINQTYIMPRFMLTSGVIFVAVYVMCAEGQYISFGRLAILQSMVCALLTFLLSYKLTGIDIIIVPFLMTGMLTGILEYMGYTLRLYGEESRRC